MPIEPRPIITSGPVIVPWTGQDLLAADFTGALRVTGFFAGVLPGVVLAADALAAAVVWAAAAGLATADF